MIWPDSTNSDTNFHFSAGTDTKKKHVVHAHHSLDYICKSASAYENQTQSQSNSNFYPTFSHQQLSVVEENMLC